VLVDEYQDTNALQANTLKRLSPEGRGLSVVGDDAQSIYSFRAATVHNILDFPKTWPGATVLKLEQNYRSVQPILDATNSGDRVVPNRYNKDLFSRRRSAQKPKLVTLVDEDQQSDYVHSPLLQHLEAGIPLSRQAVLFRTAHHSDALEVELARRNIPFVKYGGLKFLEAAQCERCPLDPSPCRKPARFDQRLPRPANFWMASAPAMLAGRSPISRLAGLTFEHGNPFHRRRGRAAVE